MSQIEHTPKAATVFPPAPRPEQPLGEGPLLPERSDGSAGQHRECDKRTATSGDMEAQESVETL